MLRGGEVPEERRGGEHDEQAPEAGGADDAAEGHRGASRRAAPDGREPGRVCAPRPRDQGQDGRRVAPEGGAPAPVGDHPLRWRREGVGGHGPAERDAGGQAPAAHVGVRDEGGVGRHPGQSQADAAADPHREQEEGERGGRAPDGHDGPPQADQPAGVPVRHQVPGNRAQQRPADPEQRRGCGRGGARAAEVGQQGGQEHREGIGDSGHQQHRREGEPEPLAGKGLPRWSRPRMGGTGPGGPGRLSRPPRPASWPCGASCAPRPASACA